MASPHSSHALLGNRLKRSISINNLATLGLDKSAVAVSRIRGEPINIPIPKRHCLSKRNKGRLGSKIQTSIKDDSTSGLKSGLHLKTCMGKPLTNRRSFSQSLLKSPSCCMRMSMCLGSRCPREKLPFGPSSQKLGMFFP